MCQCFVGDVGSSAQWIFVERSALDAVSTTKSTGNVKISQLKFVNVTVAGIDCTALCDSGAQIPVINRHLFDLRKGDVVGSIELPDIVGRSVDASLVKLYIRLGETANAYNITPDLPVVCAVVDINATDYDLILPSDVVDELNELPVISVLKPSVSVLTVNNEWTVSSDVQGDAKDGQYTNGGVMNVDQLTDDVNDCDVDKLIKEQKSDETLFHCWAMAREQKETYMSFRVVCCYTVIKLNVSLSFNCVFLPIEGIMC